VSQREGCADARGPQSARGAEATCALGSTATRLLAICRSYRKLWPRNFGGTVMGDNSNLGFGKFVPGFDFLQNLAKGASQTLPQMPNLANWIAPTLNVEELEKRISDLKAVHFWLDQNAKALGATIQALEVQKMTLATLKGMNFNMGDVANALKLKTPDSVPAAPKATEPAASAPSAPKNAKPRTDEQKDDGK